MKSFSEFSSRHAVIRMYGNNTYGHIDAVIRNLDEGNYRSPSLRVSCQIGPNESDSFGARQRQETYAWHCGIRGSNDAMSLSEMEVGIKYMRRIERKLAQMEAELGAPTLFSDYCARILVASGVNHVFINHDWGGFHVGLDKLQALELNKRSSRVALLDALQTLEQRLFDQYRNDVRAA
jgi:hypothetical protein